jgi:hypothetical protein
MYLLGRLLPFPSVRIVPEPMTVGLILPSAQAKRGFVPCIIHHVALAVCVILL